MALKDLFKNYTSQPASPSPSRTSIPPVTNYSNEKTTNNLPTASGGGKKELIKQIVANDQDLAANKNITPPKNTTSTSIPTSFSGNTLYKGIKSDEVKFLQQLLGIDVDGSFGSQTDAAVRAFQKANGLTVDGRVGPQTRAALLGLPIPSSGSSGDSSGGSSSTKSSSTPKPSTPAPVAPQAPVQSTAPEFQFDLAMPEFNFDYQIQPVQSMEELIALAAQQLNPQYDLIRRQAENQHKDTLQNIENDAIRRGRAQSTYAGNRQDNATSDYNELLSNISTQQQAHATDLGRQDYEKALAREQENYDRAYREAIDAYNRAMAGWSTNYDMASDAYNREWGQYQDSYQREQDAWQRKMAEQELAMQEALNKWQMSQPRYSSSGGSSSSSKTNNLTAGDRSLVNNANSDVQEIIQLHKSGSISQHDAAKRISEARNKVMTGNYLPQTREELLRIIDSANRTIANQRNEFEEKSYQQRKAARQ